MISGGCNQVVARGRRLAALTILALGALLGTAGAAAAAPVLPDLDQWAPANLDIQQVGSQQRLGFDSAVTNIGSGPFKIKASRSSTAIPDMTASQVVSQSDGSTVTYPNVGTVRYVIGGGHSHWHFINLETYSLNRLDGTTLERDRKTGFCFGNLSEPHGSRCGENQPGLLQVAMGLGAGWGDVYRAHLEGQYIDITAIPTGDYVLVHRSNAAGTLRETTLANNAGSVRIRLSKHKKKRNSATSVSILATCPNTATC
jgi:hypothetical protein